MKVKGSNNQIIIAGRDVNYVSLSKAEIKAIAKAVCLELKKYPTIRSSEISIRNAYA